MLHSVCVEADVTIDNTGSTVSLPVIVTPDGLLRSYLDYLIVHRHKSRSWVERSAFAIRLLIDYTKQNEECFEKPLQLFREFANSLFTGTIGENGIDPSWLRWEPRASKDAKFLIDLITNYTDWLAEQNDEKRLQINPVKKPTDYEQWMSLAAYSQRRERAFLSHLWSNRPAPSSYRYVAARKTSRSGGGEAKSFPEGRFDGLLWNGFVRYGFEASNEIYDRLDLRNVLITMLMHYGGLRVSECFHVWVEDITPWDDGTALVKVYHPSEGKQVAIGPSRREELRKRFGLKPRFEYPKSHAMHSGWKDPHEDDPALHYLSVYWFPNSAGEIFNELWRLYLTHQRVPAEGEHPFAFTTRTGAPYSIKGYNQALKRAVNRIGLPFSKEAGTTAHAHRHSYGNALKNAGTEPLIIKKAMHHKSLESQNVYGELTQKQMRAHLERIEKGLKWAQDPEDLLGIPDLKKGLTHVE
ncbi:MAG: site-specific integrase [Marinobacter sp.]|uniref:gamma-mobile-trio recombinase GmtY n=1 Tax=Marinobacter sp. TaxID=50741 RepID=UPI001B5382B1|nr:gamma-mobile-trio recombinase GmtY [Marinobacter sp.]MBQ0746747.1 site-specific integrase [Marinobacter sp.]MBQ0815487.1 site-specific integrase [Marinobacter sp.]